MRTGHREELIPHCIPPPAAVTSAFPLTCLFQLSETQALVKGKVSCFQIGSRCSEDRTEDPQLLEPFLEAREVVLNRQSVLDLHWCPNPHELY